MSYLGSPCGIFPLNAYSVQGAQDYPLVNAICNTKVIDVYTVTELVQEYASIATDSREVQYTFPISSSAAVYSFKAAIDGTVINGVVKAKDEARRIYDGAVASGKKAAILEKRHIDLFTISLGNVKPSQKIVVHISYVSMISHDGGSSDTLRLTIPITIATRYGEHPVSLPSSKPLNAFKLNLTLQMSGPITAISSTTHPISTVLGRQSIESTEKHDPNFAVLTLEDSQFLDKDIVIVISSQKLDQPRCMAERWLVSNGAEETTHAYALTMAPKFNVPPVKSQEYIFLVDRSGSMGGPRIESVRNALQIMLRSLPSRKTTFNIISFGSHSSSLWPTSQPYNAATVEHASQHVETMDADYGGTELGQALNFAYASKARSDPEVKPSTVVFILTDGDSYDLRGVTDVVAASAKSAKQNDHLLRTFVLGVGDDVAVGMCETIARVGNGTAVFVGYNEKPEEKLIALLRAARGAVIDDITIDWGIPGEESQRDEGYEIIDVKHTETTSQPDSQQEAISLFDPLSKPMEQPELGPEEAILPPPLTIQQAPKSSALSFPIYSGFRCSIFAIVKPQADTTPFASSVKIRGSASGVPVYLDIPVQTSLTDTTLGPGQGAGEQPLHILAARALIESFGDEAASTRANAEIKRLGLRYSLATSVTSFVAIEEASSETILVEEKIVLNEEDSDDDMGFGLYDDDDLVMDDFHAALPDEEDDDDMGMALELDDGSYQKASQGSIKLATADMGISKKTKQRSPTNLKASAAMSPLRSLAGPPPPPPSMSPSQRVLGAVPPPMASASPPGFGSASAGPPPLTLAALAKVQGFDGMFLNTPTTVSLLLQGQPVPQVSSVLENTSLASEDKANIWVTVLALAVLQTEFSTDSERAAWSLLAEKAREVVRDMLVDGGIAEDNVEGVLEELEREATRFL